MVQLILAPVMWMLKGKSPYIKNLLTAMFFSEIYFILVHGYLEFVFIPLFNLQSVKGDPDLNAFTSAYSKTMLIITLVVLPLAMLYVILQT